MQCLFAEFSGIFGNPNEGIHTYRLLNLAIIDIIATIIGAFIISYLFNLNFILCLLCLFLLGIILHKLFCVNTTINKLIFGEINK